MIISGIGSRETPFDILDEMVKIGAWCLAQNVLVRSGHAEGADYAFEQGAAANCIAFLPWASFNSNLKILGKAVVVSELYDAEIAKYHKAPHNLTQGARKLMARNVCQIIHEAKPVDAVVCWRKKSGGTDFALAIATDLKIPIYNMYLKEFNTSEKVIEKLQEIKSNEN